MAMVGNEKDLWVLSLLRSNARLAVVEIGRKTGMPASTVFDRMKKLHPLVLKYTTLIDFAEFGQPIRLVLLMNGSCLESLMEAKAVNSIYRLADGELLAECVFADNAKAQDFLESFQCDIHQVVTVIEDVIREKFLACKDSR